MKLSKKSNRILATILTVAMVFGLLPSMAFATSPSGVGNAWVDPRTTGETSTGFKEYQQEEAVNGHAADKVTVSKAATKVLGEENLFDIELIVTTQEDLEGLKIAPDAAVVLVLDTSGSMAYEPDKEETATVGNQRIDALKTALNGTVSTEGFLDVFADTEGVDNVKRMVSIIDFNTDAAMVSLGGSYWVDVTNNANLATAKSTVTGLQAGGGTNMEAGLRLANNMLNSSSFNGPISTIQNRYVILLSDGLPTFFCDNTVSSSATSISAGQIRNNFNMLIGDNTGSTTNERDYTDIPGVVSTITANHAFNT